MAGIFNDDSTDDEIGVNLQLAERLRINRGDNGGFGDTSKFENSKDFKQFYNLRRKKFAEDGRSSSSSSDNPLSGIISSDIYHNKKRQNGDKNIELLANPKRTCLSDRYRKTPEWRDLKKKSSNNGYQSEQSKYLEPFHLQSPDIFSSKKNEDHINNLTDSEDSDFEVPKLSRNSKKDNHISKPSKNQSSIPKTVHFQNHDESGPSTSYANNLFESGTDEETKGICKSGSLKGGRQEPSDGTHYTKRLFGRKVNKKVLDSDESEDDHWQSCYRSTKPLIFSSSDSEDFIDKNKHTSNDTTSNGSSSQSLSCDGFERNGLRPPKQYKSIRSNQKISKKSVCLMPPYRADSSDSCDRQFLSSDFQRKSTSNRPCRARRSPRINMSSNVTSNGFNTSCSISNPTRGRRLGGGERGTRRSGSPHHRNLRSQYREHESNCSRGRSVSAPRPQKDVTNFASRYPDIFDAEESDNEFFTANSYSDTETSTESLGGLASSEKFSNHRSPVSCSLNCDENRFEDASTDDEISVVFSSATPHSRNCESRRGASRTLGRRYNRGGTPHRQLQSTQEVVSLSPDPVEQVRQVEEDERIARILQEQFDAELDPDFVPISHDVLLSHEDSDDEIIDPVLGDSDSDSGRRYPSYAAFPRNTFRTHYPNRPGTPNSFSAAIFFSPRRNDRSRRRFHASREQRSNLHFAARLFGVALPIFDGEDDYETLLSLDLNEVAPRGLQKTQINRLPTRKYIHPNSSGSSETTHKRAELNKECQVCLTDYETGDTLRILPCFHEFHTPCIDPWLKINHTCPVCRVTVDLDT